MHATLSVETCKARRKDNGKRHSSGGMASQRTISYLECMKCPQGELVDQGLIVDLMDAHVRDYEREESIDSPESFRGLVERGIKQLTTKEAIMKIVTESAVPSGIAADAVNEASAAAAGSPTASKAETGGKEAETRKCRKCKHPKSLDGFSRKAKGSEERIAICKDCKRQIDKDYRKKKDTLGAVTNAAAATVVGILVERDGSGEALPELGPEVVYPSGSGVLEEVGSGEAATSPAAGSEKSDFEADLLYQMQNFPLPIHDETSRPVIGAGPNALTIDFADYPDILETIKALAHDFDRTPEAQVRWWLRCSFDAARACAEEAGKPLPVRFSVLDPGRCAGSAEKGGTSTMKGGPGHGE